jgi:large repetitive protein
VGIKAADRISDISTRLRKNTVTNTNYGISVGHQDQNGNPAPDGGIVSDNDSSGNNCCTNGTGFQIIGSGILVTDNTANNNAQYGINTAPGTIDGGGNRASGNGNAQQCVNVTCTP